MTALLQETPTARPLDEGELHCKIDAWWRAANYLSVGTDLSDGQSAPAQGKPLKKEDVKPRLLGHWGTTPGLNLIYVHLNRVIRSHRLNAIYVCGNTFARRARHGGEHDIWKARTRRFIRTFRRTKKG